MPSEGANFNMFFTQLPGAGLQWWLLVISTIATVLASQAMISGAFSTLHQVCSAARISLQVPALIFSGRQISAAFV